MAKFADGVSPRSPAVFRVAADATRPSVGPVAGRIADFFRFWWALVYWNGRKTLFRLRPGSPCPCQAPSDSGRARETRCEASLGWARPAGFRRVCPLLVATAEGWRCGVDTAGVRPFWGRAALSIGGSLAGVYLAATLAVFAGMRVIGYPVAYGDVAWPPAWAGIDAARSRYFLRRGLEALAAQQVREALFSLSLAHELAPHDYDTGFALASLLQATQPALSDRLYAALLADHPARQEQTADAWHRALLARGDFARSAKLAAGEFRQADSVHAAYWLNSLLFSTRRLGDDGPLRALAAGPPPPAPPWRRVLQTELLAREGHAAAAAELAGQVWPEATEAFVPFYQARLLIELGRPERALVLIDQYKGRLGDDERYALRLDAFARLGWSALRQGDVMLLLQPPPTGPVIALLARHLARHPDAELLDEVFARLGAAPLPVAAANREAFAALFCAAGIGRDFARMHALAEPLRRCGSPGSAVAALEDFFQGVPPPRHIESLLPSMPLSLDLTYLLLDRYADPPGVSAKT